MRAQAGEVSPLTPDAAEAAAALARACGWGHEAADWRARLAAGRGFAIRDGARLVGAVGLHDAGPGLFMGMLLTDPGARGRGIGSALTRACIAAAEAAGKPLGLFATALGRPIYERMGFEAPEGVGLTSWRGTGPGAGGTGAPAGPRRATPADLSEILRRDARATGQARAPLVADLLVRGPEFALVVEGGGGLAGFALGVGRSGTAAPGPILAGTPEAARALLSAQLAAVAPGRPVRLDAPQGDGRLAGLLGAAGLVPSDPIPFMIRPAPDGRRFRPWARPEEVFAALSAFGG